MGRKKLPPEIFNKAITLLYVSGDKREDLARFDKFIFNYAMFLSCDISLTDPKEKAVDDLYLEKNGSEIIVKGTIPENYTYKELSFAIRDLLFSYLNAQHIRGKNAKDIISWIYACWDFNINTLGFNKSIFKTQNKFEIIPEARKLIYLNTIDAIEKQKNENPKKFVESEEQYYKILENKNKFSKSYFDIIKSIEEVQERIEKEIKNSFTNQEKLNELEHLLDILKSNIFDKGIQDNIRQLNKHISNKEIKNDVDKVLKEIYELSRYVPINFIKQSFNYEKFNQIRQEIISSLMPVYQKMKGNFPGNLEKILDNIFKLELPWEKILEKALETKLEVVESKRWNYPNIYLKSVRYLPSNDVESKINTIVIFIDTSGSISEDDLKKFFGIVLDLVEKVNISKLIIVQHDYEIQKIDEIETDFVQDKSEITSLITVKGRGGTSHTVPWKQFEEKVECDELPYPDFIIFLSDFYSDFENLIDKLKKEPYEFFCVITNDGNVLKEFKEGEYLKIK